MSKYDTVVQLEDNNSLTYMIKNIHEGATVLEFGPSTGYVTRYLKEKLNCSVYIVEIDLTSYESAIQYAEEGVLGNIEDYIWMERFRSIKFDYIMFADVLEHLYQPWEVLTKAKAFLKEDGKILISIPNIAHNAVIIDLINNKFEYKDTGILDNTHVRFFTYFSLKSMFKQCGLVSVNEDAVRFGFEYVGFDNGYQDVSESIKNDLEYRKYGFVNQFLFSLVKEESELAVKSCCELSDERQLECCLYYDCGEGISEAYRQNGKLFLSDGSFHVDFELHNIKNIKKLRFDPCEFPCKINELNIETNIDNISIIDDSGFMIGDMKAFVNGDPYFIVLSENFEGIEYIRFTGTLQVLSAEDMRRCCIEIGEKAEAKEMALIHRQKEFEKLVIQEKEEIIRQQEESKKLVIQEKEEIIRQQEELKKLVIQENERLIHQQNETNVILQEKDKLLRELGDSVRGLNQRIEQREAELEAIYSSSVWKITKNLYRGLREIKEDESEI